MEVQGRIKLINEETQVGASFKKRELVVTTDEQYPQHIIIEFTQDKCDILNKYNPGDSVKVSVNLRGREWVNPQGEAKYFNSIQGWRIEKQDSSVPPVANNSPQFEPTTNFKEEEEDNLPF